MTTERDFPDAVQRLYIWLVGHGFTVASDIRGGMGGVLLTLTGQIGLGPAAWIEISGDRGQWSIRLRFDGMSRYIATQSWAAYLDSVGISEPDVQQQAAFVENRLSDAALAYMANPTVESDLVRTGEEYMRNKYPKLFP